MQPSSLQAVQEMDQKLAIFKLEDHNITKDIIKCHELIHIADGNVFQNQIIWQKSSMFFKTKTQIHLLPISFFPKLSFPHKESYTCPEPIYSTFIGDNIDLRSVFRSAYSTSELVLNKKQADFRDLSTFQVVENEPNKNSFSILINFTDNTLILLEKSKDYLSADLKWKEVQNIGKLFQMNNPTFLKLMKLLKIDIADQQQTPVARIAQIGAPLFSSPASPTENEIPNEDGSDIADDGNFTPKKTSQKPATPKKSPKNVSDSSEIPKGNKRKRVGDLDFRKMILSEVEKAFEFDKTTGVEKKAEFNLSGEENKRYEQALDKLLDENKETMKSSKIDRKKAKAAIKQEFRRRTKLKFSRLLDGGEKKSAGMAEAINIEQEEQGNERLSQQQQNCPQPQEQQKELEAAPEKKSDAQILPKEKQPDKEGSLESPRKRRRRTTFPGQINFALEKTSPYPANGPESQNQTLIPSNSTSAQSSGQINFVLANPIPATNPLNQETISVPELSTAPTVTMCQQKSKKRTELHDILDNNPSPRAILSEISQITRETEVEKYLIQFEVFSISVADFVVSKNENNLSFMVVGFSSGLVALLSRENGVPNAQFSIETIESVCFSKITCIKFLSKSKNEKNLSFCLGNSKGQFSIFEIFENKLENGDLETSFSFRKKFDMEDRETILEPVEMIEIRNFDSDFFLFSICYGTQHVKIFVLKRTLQNSGKLTFDLQKSSIFWIKNEHLDFGLTGICISHGEMLQDLENLHIISFSVFISSLDGTLTETKVIFVRNMANFEIKDISRKWLRLFQTDKPLWGCSISPNDVFLTVLMENEKIGENRHPNTVLTISQLLPDKLQTKSIAIQQQTLQFMTQKIIENISSQDNNVYFEDIFAYLVNNIDFDGNQKIIEKIWECCFVVNASFEKKLATLQVSTLLQDKFLKKEKEVIAKFSDKLTIEEGSAPKVLNFLNNTIALGKKKKLLWLVTMKSKFSLFNEEEKKFAAHFMSLLYASLENEQIEKGFTDFLNECNASGFIKEIDVQIPKKQRRNFICCPFCDESAANLEITAETLEKTTSNGDPVLFECPNKHPFYFNPLDPLFSKANNFNGQKFCRLCGTSSGIVPTSNQMCSFCGREI